MVESNVIGSTEDGSRAALPGYDHGWFGWQPMPARRQPRWPGDARLAVCVVLNLGAVEWERTGPGRVPPPGGRGIGPYPDFPRISHREFGHRVGVFRLLDIARDLDIPLAAAVDVLTVQHYPSLFEHLVPAVRELVAAGLSASRPITGDMAEDEERDYIDTAGTRLTRAFGLPPAGWVGPEHSESARTPRLLAEAGFEYLADWCNDDAPYAMPGAGELWSCPLSWELSDLSAMFLRQGSPASYARSLVEATQVLGEEGGGMLGLQLYPWVSGQAFRAGAVAEALARIRADERIWLATPGEIVRWCRDS